ncbi:ABC transporter ATP-binding protein [Mycetocola reblochoni]|uniref:Alkanesulfonates ABC transporter ATP-binding protein / Sulfonate ABC transporter, ATP-binding subunit SsuB n=2 Tax=Mycetocola reblochoni TaxID=331618 RepID=A0A1R4IA90_9MICO|nr:ABC transporter ATP-binding protein [Mycetocola reblochoni]RLP70158.1 ABC transporter ATP-binding protein [Mycetocola reblochoni]SJN16718.1 Alkanesulfonates ABC transporter ATP-binding protein / Sulfonate ABC transporter, ATP-binding subunit SsuB [Mycetocola reblochoni REB411]
MSVEVALESVTKRFGDVTVLDGLELRIPRGEFVAVVGQSGCGKSTLLRAIAGLEPISAGRIELDGERVDGPSNRVRVMFQDDRLLPWQTVGRNIELVTKDPAATAQVLDSVGLGAKADAWPSTLSGGQRQRVALARALASDPELILFDEPLGALDAFTRVEMQKLIENLWEERGFTAVLVTHDVAEAVALADRVIVLADGRVSVDRRIDLPRPRRRDQAFYSHEEDIFNRIIDRQGLTS